MFLVRAIWARDRDVMDFCAHGLCINHAVMPYIRMSSYQKPNFWKLPKTEIANKKNPCNYVAYNGF